MSRRMWRLRRRVRLPWVPPFFGSEVVEVVAKGALGGVGEGGVDFVLEGFDLAEHAFEFLFVVSFGGIEFGFAEGEEAAALVEVEDDAGRVLRGRFFR